MDDGDNTALVTFGKIGAWLKENKDIAIPVAAGLLGLGAASLSRRREVRRSYEEGFESGWDAAQRRELGSPAAGAESAAEETEESEE